MTTPREYVFDLETTPIDKTDRRKLPQTIHCIVIANVENGHVKEFGPGEIETGLWILQCAHRLIGHSIATFDIPVLEQIYGDRWTWDGEIYDTLAASRLIYASNLTSRTMAWRNDVLDDAERDARIPLSLVHAHKLEAWGYRLRIAKEHAHVEESFFHAWSPELQARCASDVRINLELYKHLKAKPAAKGWPLCADDASVLSDSRVAYIVGKQERNGVGFDRAKAVELMATLAAERVPLEAELRRAVPAWLAPNGDVVTPKRSMVRTKGLKFPQTYTEGAQYQRIQTVEFQPGSAQHRWWALAGRESRTLKQGKPLSERVYGPVGYGWEPKEFTACGQAITDEETLAGLPYPIIPNLLRHVTIAKRLSQLSDGQEAWLKKEKNGRIHGGVHVTGTRTSRAAHHRPNLGQVPKVSSLYGPECRRLFRPTRVGWVQVGVDAKGLELRMLAHRLAPIDGGAFAKVVLDGDPHTLWMRGTGLFIRDNQKTWTYAFLYGAGNVRLGEIILSDWRDAARKGLTDEPAPPQEYAEELGKASRRKLLRHFRALEKLLEECRKNKERGYITALDGRILACPNEHGALNDLLQSDGAILIKYAMVLWYRYLCDAYRKPGDMWAPMLWVHDEWQFECLPEIASYVGQLVSTSITDAGKQLGVQCLMEGEFKVGGNWCETH